MNTTVGAALNRASKTSMVLSIVLIIFGILALALTDGYIGRSRPFACVVNPF